MPKMDGFDATRRIRSDMPADHQPTIIAMTAGALVDDQAACAAAGMDNFVTKPIRTQQLAAALSLHGRSGNQASRYRDLPSEITRGT